MDAEEIDVCCQALFFQRTFKSAQNICGILRRRRKKRAVIKAWAYAAVIAATSVQRNVWALERTQDWWDRVVVNWNQEEWVSNFHMRRETFNMLCERLSPRLSYKDTKFRQAIPVQKRVGVGLWWFATGTGYLGYRWKPYPHHCSC